MGTIHRLREPREAVSFSEMELVLLGNMLADLKPASTGRFDLLAMLMSDLRDHWDTPWRADLLALYKTIKRMPADRLREQIDRLYPTN